MRCPNRRCLAWTRRRDGAIRWWLPAALWLISILRLPRILRLPWWRCLPRCTRLPMGLMRVSHRLGRARRRRGRSFVCGTRRGDGHNARCHIDGGRRHALSGGRVERDCDYLRCRRDRIGLLHVRGGLHAGWHRWLDIPRHSRRCDARQDLGVDLRSDDVALFRLEACHEADLALQAADFVPGDPDAVGMPDLRLAVVFGQLFFGEDVLAIGGAARAVAVGVVEGEHHQLAFDLDRFVGTSLVKHDAAAKAAHGGLARSVQDRVGPNRHHAVGLAWLCFLGPGDRLAKVEPFGADIAVGPSEENQARRSHDCHSTHESVAPAGEASRSAGSRSSVGLFRWFRGSVHGRRLFS